MLASYNSSEARANFVCIPGREIDYDYDSAGNVIKETYKEGSIVVFAVNYEYNSNGNVTKVYCTND